MIEPLTISQVAQRAGIRTSTIRYYEQIDLLPAARRSNGRRQYDASILERLSPFFSLSSGLGNTIPTRYLRISLLTCSLSAQPDGVRQQRHHVSMAMSLIFSTTDYQVHYCLRNDASFSLCYATRLRISRKAT